MADQPISGLTALTAAATGDLLEIVDVSDTTMAATGTNKKITAGQVLASGLPGSFSTLAASGAVTATISTGAAITYSGNFDNSGGGAGTGSRIQFRNTGTGYGAFGYVYDGNFVTEIDSQGSSAIRQKISNTTVTTVSSTGLAVTGAVSATGSVGVGAAASAWTRKAVQITDHVISYCLADTRICVGANHFYDGAYKYIQGGYAGQYFFDSVNGKHSWTASPSGSANGAVTFTTLLALEKDKSLALQGATPQTGAGITFPATVSASTDVNTLDDYDEYTAASAACTGAITTAAVWKLTKVGNKVTLTLPAVTGTATAVASFTFGTAIPAKYRAASSTQFICSVYDNGAAKTTPGVVFIDASGNIYVMANLNRTTAYTSAAAAGLEYITAVSWTI